MKYIKQFVQETVVAQNPKEFDIQMNAVFTKASRGGRDPEVYYRDGYSATVRYWIQSEIPETLAEEFELAGRGKKCYECPAYVASQDKRIKYTTCEHSETRISGNDNCCDWYYETYERRVKRSEVKTVPFRKESVRSEQA